MYYQNLNQAEKKKDLKTLIEIDTYDFLDGFFERPAVRILLFIGVVVGGVYAGGKVLRLLGGVIKDGKYFVNALNEK